MGLKGVVGQEEGTKGDGLSHPLAGAYRTAPPASRFPTPARAGGYGLQPLNWSLEAYFLPPATLLTGTTPPLQTPVMGMMTSFFSSWVNPMTRVPRNEPESVSGMP